MQEDTESGKQIEEARTDLTDHMAKTHYACNKVIMEMADRIHHDCDEECSGAKTYFVVTVALNLLGNIVLQVARNDMVSRRGMASEVMAAMDDWFKKVFAKIEQKEMH